MLTGKCSKNGKIIVSEAVEFERQYNRINQFFRENDKRLQNLETVVVGFSKNEMSNQCKYQGVAIDKHIVFHKKTRNVLKKMAVGIETIETIQHKLPTTVVLMLFYSLLLSHLEFSALFLLRSTSSVLLSLKKQMNWSVKFVYFRSSINVSFNLTLQKSLLAIRQQTELK